MNDPSPSALLSRAAAWTLLTEWTAGESLRKHALAVEASVRGYARKFAEDEEAWGVVALLHDFDYERYQTPADHPFRGCEELQRRGYPEWRAQLGLGAGDPGVLVSRVDLGGSCDGLVQPRDLLVSIEGLPIASDDTIEHAGLTLRHYAALGTKHVGDRVRLGIRSDGSPANVDVTLAPWLPLVPRARHDIPHAYYVYAGLVFQPLTRDYLTTWESWWDKAPKEFLNAYFWGRRTGAQLEIVALTAVLEDPLNAGYARYCDESVVRVGDCIPRDLNDFVSLLEAARGYVTIEMSGGGLITLETDAVTRTFRARDEPYKRG